MTNKNDRKRDREKGELRTQERDIREKYREATGGEAFAQEGGYNAGYVNWLESRYSSLLAACAPIGSGRRSFAFVLADY